jgi:DNA-binding NarL/FixJ family response regulator
MAPIVEDVPASAAWLAAAVAAAFARAGVTVAETVAAAKAALASAPPTLALVDLDLPDGSGTEVIEALVRLPRRPVVIVATVFADDQHVFPALRAGASGYVLKDATISELAESLDAAMRGDAVLAARVAKRLVGWFHDRPPATGRR